MIEEKISGGDVFFLAIAGLMGVRLISFQQFSTIVVQLVLNAHPHDLHSGRERSKVAQPLTLDLGHFSENLLRQSHD